jgi:hypothetical protein
MGVGHLTVYDVLDRKVRPSHVTWQSSVGEVYLYIRRTRRYLGGQMVESADVATIDVEHQGRGACREFFDFWEREAQARSLHVYVESILDPAFKAWFLRRGYLESSIDPQSVYFPHTQG